MPFDAPVTTAVLPDNLFMIFHPPNFPSTDVLANLRKETADRGGDRSFVDGCREPMAHFHRYRRALFPRQRCEHRSYPAGNRTGGEIFARNGSSRETHKRRQSHLEAGLCRAAPGGSEGVRRGPGEPNR
jgi:hypothetical protein